MESYFRFLQIVSEGIGGRYSGKVSSTHLASIFTTSSTLRPCSSSERPLDSVVWEGSVK